MRRGHWAVIAASAAIGAVVLLAAGCGGGTGSALSLDPVAAAATKTQQAGAAKVRFVLHVEGANRAFAVHGAGAIEGASSELTFNAAPGSALPQLGGGPMEEISLEQNGDYVLYLQLASLAAQLPGGKHWVELDVSKLGKSAGVDIGKLLSGSQIQPGDLLSLLQAEGADIRNLGSATVDGAATTHYRGTIDTAKALQAKGLTSPLLAGAAAELPKVPVDAWIGADGLLRRIKFTASTAQGRLGMTMDLYDYGANVTISAPPDSDVFDATQLVQQGIPNLSH
jgi:LppX_LprAFG lipoprotein